MRRQASSPRGATHCPCHRGSMCHQRVTVQIQVSCPAPVTQAPSFSVASCSAHGHSRKLATQYPTHRAPSSQTSGNTDHSDGRITIFGTDRIPVITKALCKYKRNLSLSLGDKLIFVLIIWEGTETQKGYVICSTQQK